MAFSYHKMNTRRRVRQRDVPDFPEAATFHSSRPYARLETILAPKCAVMNDAQKRVLRHYGSLNYTDARAFVANHRHFIDGPLDGVHCILGARRCALDHDHDYQLVERNIGVDRVISPEQANMLEDARETVRARFRTCVCRLVIRI